MLKADGQGNGRKKMTEREQKVVFLTGATGRVGRNLIPVPLGSENASIALLIRARRHAPAAGSLTSRPN
jgi:hypothetical protein